MSSCEDVFLAALRAEMQRVGSGLNRRTGYALRGTARITRAVERVAVACEASVEREVRISLSRKVHRKDGREKDVFGHVDLLVTLADGTPVFIEIDRANKQWSLRKLVHCHEIPGTLCVWIRWKGRALAEIPPGIDVIDIRKRRSTLPRQSNSEPAPFAAPSLDELLAMD